jgi:hypothetical protein
MKSRWWKVGALLPSLMAVLLACDLAGRFLPVELFAFRTWEPALRRSAGGPGPFEPGAVVAKRSAYGDLAAMGSFRQLRQYHREEFRVDRLGYRNGFDIDKVRYAGVADGDSFAVAAGVREVETLAGQLTRLAGARFYNAGGLEPSDPKELTWLAAQLKIYSGVVVYELLERRARDFPPAMIDAAPAAGSPPPPAAPAKGAGRLPPWLEEVALKLSRPELSPLRLLEGKLVRSYLTDRLQPNPDTNRVVRETLANGDEMLFIERDLESVGDIPALSSAWSRYLAWFAQRLQAHNLRLVVLVVPNKYTVYGPLPGGAPRRPEGEGLLQRVEEALRSAGLPVVNVTAEFQARAAQQLARHEYLYWRDDTHWNASGISLAADAAWKGVQSMPAPRW